LPYDVRIESKQHAWAWCREKGTGSTCVHKGQCLGQRHVFTPIDLRIKFCNELKAYLLKGIPPHTLLHKIRRHAVLKATVDIKSAF